MNIISKEHFTFDKIINYFILLQIVSIGFSIALSSISLSVWVVLWGFKLYKEKDFSSFKLLFSKYKYFFISFGIYIIVDMLSRIFAYFPEDALIGLKRYLLLICFFSNPTVIKSKGEILRNILIIATVFSILSCIEIFKFALTLSENLKTTSFSEIRIDYFSYPITAGEIKMLILMAIFPFVLSKNKYKIKKVYLIIILIPILVSLFLTQSRNVYLGVLIALFIYGIFVNWRFLVSFILFLCLLWIVTPNSGKDRIRSIFDLNHPSNKSRIVMWDVGIKVYKDYPLLGTGDNEITKVYKLYKNPESHGEGSHFHSNPVMILATTGTIGALFYVLIWATLFYYTISDYRKAKNIFDKEILIGIIIAMISFHISGIFEWNFGDWEVVTLLFYLISLVFTLKFINLKNNIINGEK